MKKILLLLVISAALISCSKEPGKGGTSTIKGVVYVQEYNKDLTIKVGNPYPAQDWDVYLVYGDDEIYGDNFKTDYKGEFQFDYLQEGNYTVYVLTKTLDNRITNELVPVLEKVEITGKDQTVVVDTIQIID
jgi:hypothetical protein